MAIQADVVVKNIFAGTNGVKVFSFNNPEPTIITDGSSDRFPLHGPEVDLVVQAPEGKDTKFCLLKVQSDIDLAVTASRTKSNWTLKIISNESDPEVPTTVNVTVGDEEP